MNEERVILNAARKELEEIFTEEELAGIKNFKEFYGKVETYFAYEEE